MIATFTRFFAAPKRVEILTQRIDLLSQENARLAEENKKLLTLVRALRDVNAHLDQRLLNVGGMA